MKRVPRVAVPTRPTFSQFYGVFEKVGKQVCIPVRCVPPPCCPYLPVCTAPGGVCSRRGVCFWGVSACDPGGVYPSMQWGRHPLPPVDRILDTCLAPTSLRAINIGLAIFEDRSHIRGILNLFVFKVIGAKQKKGV